MQSKVKWFNNEKGFGFIEYNDSLDVFVHYSQIDKQGYKTLNQGDLVSFKLIETPKGLQAQEVTTIETAKAMQSFYFDTVRYYYISNINKVNS